MYVDPTLFGAPWVDQLQNAQPAVRMQGQPKRLRIDAAGKVVPGDEPAEGDWRSLAPARQQGPSMQKATNDYLSGDTSGMLQRAQAGDAAAIDAMLRRAQEDGQRAANATRLPFGLGIFDQAHSPAAQAHLAAQANAQLAPLVDQAAKAPVDAFLKAMGLGEQAFQGDTKRAEAALQEYGAKVRGPQQDALALQLERERGQTQRDVAEAAGKATLQAPIVAGIAGMASQGAPADKIKAFAETAGEATKDFAQSKQPPKAGEPAVKIDAGSKGTAAERNRKITEREAALARLGFLPPGAQPPKEGAPKFSADALVKELMDNPELAQDAAFAKTLRERGGGGLDAAGVKEAVAKAFMRRADKLLPRGEQDTTFGGARYHLRRDPGGWQETRAVTLPGGQVVHAQDINLPGAGWWHGYGDLVPFFTSDRQRQQYQREATALGDLLRQMYGGQ
jgi:hypothetical protein